MKGPKHKIIISKNEIENAISKTNTMRMASTFFNCSYRSFVKIAKEYNLYVPEKSRRGNRYKLLDILNGQHPSYPTSHLSKRLIKEGIKLYKCEDCGINEYNGKSISLELDHIDGNSQNHNLSNLKFLCPNCHSQTPTYRSKKLTMTRN